MMKWALAIGAVLVLPAVASAQDAAKGKAVFDAGNGCKQCHKIGDEPGGVAGPNLKGIVGSKPGAHDAAYASKYSAAMKQFGEKNTWDEATLNTYLSDWAKKTVPGTLMAFMGIKDEAKRKDLIAYLKSTGG